MKQIILSDRAQLSEAALLCEKYGVSVNLDTFSETDIFDEHMQAIQKNLEAYCNVQIVSIHAPYKDLCLGSKDPLIKAATMARFEYAYKVATLLKCPNVIFHHGYIPGSSAPAYWVKRSKVFFDEFLRGKEENIVFHIENQFEHSPELIGEVVSLVNDPRLKVCLDVGHAHCNSKTSPLKWIEYLKDQINFVHLHNNNGSEDQHLDFSSGSIDYKDVLRALEEHAPNSTWCIETNNLEDVEKSLKWLKAQKYFY